MTIAKGQPIVAADISAIDTKASTAATAAVTAKTTADAAASAAGTASTLAATAKSAADAAASAAAGAAAAASSAAGVAATAASNASTAATNAAAALAAAAAQPTITKTSSTSVTLTFGDGSSVLLSSGAAMTASIALSNINGIAFSAINTVLGTVTVTTTNGNPVNGVLTMTATAGGDFKLVGNQVQFAVGNVPAGGYSITLRFAADNLATPVSTTFSVTLTAQSYTLASAGVRMPNTTFSLDPALPASAAGLAAGVPGIQTDTKSEVVTMNEAISGLNITHGTSDQIALKPPSGVRAFPYFDQSAVSSSYDSLIMPLSAGTIMFSQNGASWWAGFVFTQTGTSPNHLMKVESASGVHVYIQLSSTGQIYVEQNNGACNATEPASGLTALNQRQIITVMADGSTISVFRNGTRTVQTPSGTIGGFNGAPAVFEFLNNPQGKCELIEGGPGNGSISQHNAWLADRGARYGITVNTVTQGSATQIQADYTQTYMTSANFPVSDTLPTIGGRVPGGGLTLTGGSTNVANLVFGTAVSGANITSGQQLRNNVYMNYFTGNQTSVIGSPMDTGQTPGQEAFRAVARHYDVGNPYDVHVIGTDGLQLKAFGKNNNTDFSFGNIYAGMIRLGTPILPGMVLRMRWKKPTGQYSWLPWWLFSGVQFTPGPGGNPYTNYNNDLTTANSSLIREATSGHQFEIDMDDNYPRIDNGTAIGKQIDFLAVNNYGVSWTGQAPHNVFARNTGGYLYYGSAGPPYIETPFDQSAAFYDQLFNWRNDGSNLMDLFIGPAGGTMVLVQTMYMEYDKANTYKTADGTTHTMGLHLIVGNQAIANFALGTPDTSNPTAFAASLTGTIQAIDIWQGNVVNPDSYR